MTPEQIKEVRQKLDLTQKKFADLIGCPLKTLKNWEQGRRKPGVMAVKVILSHKG
jgi:DNA-binding transcriptional regulator YiaG